MDVFEILEVLTHYFEVTASSIFEKDGTLLEFIGDEVRYCVELRIIVFGFSLLSLSFRRLWRFGTLQFHKKITSFAPWRRFVGCSRPTMCEHHLTFQFVYQALAIVKAFRQLAQAPRKAKHLLGGVKFPEVCKIAASSDYHWRFMFGLCLCIVSVNKTSWQSILDCIAEKFLSEILEPPNAWSMAC